LDELFKPNYAMKNPSFPNGFFVLLGNETMDALSVLEIDRNKDVVEKAFANQSKRAFGAYDWILIWHKLFIELVALISLSHIKKQK
jgi:hypothetical protein